MRKRFLRTELRRNLHFLPVAIIASVVLVLLVMALAYLYYVNGPLTEKNKKYVIGVVGNADEKYLNFGIETMEKADSSNRIFSYRNIASEKEAIKLRVNKKIDAYIVVPDGWMDSVVTGANDKKIKVVVADGQKGMVSILIDKVLDTASTLFTDSQASVFSVYDVAHGSRFKNADELRDKFNIEIFMLAKERNRFSVVKNLGEINGLTLEESIAVGALLFALLLMGLTNTPLFIRRNNGLLRLVAVRGAGPVSQVMCGYASYFIHSLICFTAVFAVIAVTASYFGMNVAGTFLFLIPVLILFTAVQYFLYEITSGVVNSMLLQFTVAAVMSYVSGYFYMENFFPPLIQVIGRIIPTGVAYTYAACLVSTGTIDPLYVFLSVLYAAAFIVLSALARKIKINGRSNEND